MLPQAIESTPWSLRMAPAGTWHIGPPVADISQVHRPGLTLEDHRARHQQRWVGAGVVIGIEGTLGYGDIVGRSDKAGKLPGGDRAWVHPEGVHGNTLGGAPLGVVSVRPHEKRPAWNTQHLGK